VPGEEQSDATDRPERHDRAGRGVGDRGAGLVLRRRGDPRRASQTLREQIEVADLEQALERIGYELRPRDIVLLYTGCDAKLGALPHPYGFKVACFPVKVKRASAGVARVVAFVTD
jgi:hypothetical protein